MNVSRQFRKRTPAVFVAVVLMMFMLAGCGSSKGFKFAVETGGNTDQKNMGEAAEQQTLFVSDDTKALPEISGDECEQLGDAFLNKGNLYSAYVQYEKSVAVLTSPGQYAGFLEAVGKNDGRISLEQRFALAAEAMKLIGEYRTTIGSYFAKLDFTRDVKPFLHIR